MVKREESAFPSGKHRLPVILSREEVLFLQDLGYRCVDEDGSGRKLPMATIVRALIRVVGKLDVQLAGCRNQADLEKRILDAIERYGA